MQDPFKGDFDGAGFIIDSLAIEATNIPSVGLFGYAVDCSFKNVFLRSGEIKVIQNKDFDELFMSIGGICGNLIGITYPASVNNVWSHLNIKVEAESKHINIGGIIGLAENAVTISNATCSSTITSNAKNNRTTSTGEIGRASCRERVCQYV